MSSAYLGIIGGTGFYDWPDLQLTETRSVDTPFGPPSDALRLGTLGTLPVAFIARHGAGHVYSPSTLPYRANIYALKEVGVTHLISVSAVGSLEERLTPGSLALPAQIIDRTVGRTPTFFDDGVVAHVGLADPYCPSLRQAFLALPAGAELADCGAYVCIEGPQFSTRAESALYRSWGGSVIGMTAMPEARLAREAELCYAAIAMVTDYDVWHTTAEPVSVEAVLENLHQTGDMARTLVQALASAGLPARSCECGGAMRNAICTAPDKITATARQRLGVLVADYLPPLEETLT